MQRVIDSILLLLDLDLGRAADADHCNAGRELGEPLPQLLFVVVGRRLIDQRLDLREIGKVVGSSREARRISTRHYMLPTV
jgi:hypothetical protein